jgi:hypothetical protein
MFGWYGLAIVTAELVRQSKSLVEKFEAVTFYAKLAVRLTRQQAVPSRTGEFGFAE